MPPSATPSTPNPLAARAPALFARLAVFRAHVHELLLDRLAADALGDPDFRSGPNRPEEVRAVALVLRVLTRERWGADDLRLFDACWRTAAHSELFAEPFEAERHRIHGLVEGARAALRPRERPGGPW